MRARLLGAIAICFGLCVGGATWASTPKAVGAPDSQPAGAANASQPIVSEPITSIPITSGEPVMDPDFRFSTTALALERRVEMRQWQRDASGSYAMQWSAAQIDSSRFDAAHRNPAQLPFNGSRWWTHAARLQSSAVAADVLGTLDGWQPFAPDLRQLPPNLAASFQPDGAWLSTSQDPAHPMVGDVRLQWQVLKQALPPSGIVLRDGEWRLPDTSAVATQPATPASVQPSAAPTRVQQLFGNYVPWLIGAGIVLVVLILLTRRRPRR